MSFSSDNIRYIGCMIDYNNLFFRASQNLSNVNECATKCRDTFGYPYASIGQYFYYNTFIITTGNNSFVHFFKSLSTTIYKTFPMHFVL